MIFGSTSNFFRIIRLMLRATSFPSPAALISRTTILFCRLILSLHSHCHSFSDKAPGNSCVSMLYLPLPSSEGLNDRLCHLTRLHHLLAHRRFRVAVVYCDSGVFRSLLYYSRSGNSAVNGWIGEYFSRNSDTPTINARLRRQNSRRALVIVPPDNFWYSCIHSYDTDYLHSETSKHSIHST